MIENMKCFINIEKTGLREISNTLWNKSIEEYEKSIISEDMKDVFKDAMRYRQYHSKLVSDIAIEIFECNLKNILSEVENIEYQRKILYLSSLIHDIKKLDKNHNKIGAQWVEENIKDYLIIDNQSVEDICKIISKHKQDANLKACKINLLFLILIIRVADKLSKLKEKSNYMEIKEEEISNIVKKVRKKTLENSIKDLKKDIECFFDNIIINSDIMK